jgi:hypothetical protein
MFRQAYADAPAGQWEKERVLKKVAAGFQPQVGRVNARREAPLTGSQDGCRHLEFTL